MRSKIFLSLVAVLVLSMISFSAASHVTTVNAQGTTCADADYLKGVGTDFTQLGTDLKAIDATKVDSIIGGELSISVLRQKYEDLANVPASCYTTNVLIIAYAANLNDLLTLQTGLISDPKNADTYNKAITNQKDRVTKFQTLVTTSFGGAAATPAATASGS